MSCGWDRARNRRITSPTLCHAAPIKTRALFHFNDYWIVNYNIQTSKAGTKILKLWCNVSTLTTLVFLGSRLWKWRATCSMASLKSTSSSVWRMFFAFPKSSSSPCAPPHNTDMSERERRSCLLLICCHLKREFDSCEL